MPTRSSNPKKKTSNKKRTPVKSVKKKAVQKSEKPIKKTSPKTKLPSKSSKSKQLVLRSKQLEKVPIKVTPPISIKRPVWKQPIFYLFVGIVGINLTLASGLYYVYSRTVLSFKASPSIVADANLRGPQPTEVIINAAKIDLPIIPAQIKEGVWEIPEATAGHLYTSARPGEGNNIVVYAHNKKHLFGPLHQVKVGDIIAIKTDKNSVYEYTISERIIAKPDQIELVSPTDHEVLTVYTCTGFLDSQRLVLKAYPTRVSSSN